MGSGVDPSLWPPGRHGAGQETGDSGQETGDSGQTTADGALDAPVFCLLSPVYSAKVFSGVSAGVDLGSALLPSCPRMDVVKAREANRTISTGKLRALPRLHPRPIDVVVYHGSQGDLVWRWVSRLDAFSGYPVRT